MARLSANQCGGHTNTNGRLALCLILWGGEVIQLSPTDFRSIRYAASVMDIGTPLGEEDVGSRWLIGELDVFRVLGT